MNFFFIFSNSWFLFYCMSSSKFLRFCWLHSVRGSDDIIHRLELKEGWIQAAQKWRHDKFFWKCAGKLYSSLFFFTEYLLFRSFKVLCPEDHNEDVECWIQLSWYMRVSKREDFLSYLTSPVIYNRGFLEIQFYQFLEHSNGNTS